MFDGSRGGWELRIEWQQGVYVRNKQWLRLSLLRRQSDHTEGEVPVDCCQLQVGVHTAPSHWYSLLPGLSCCSVLHWELRIEWQQGVYVRNKQWLRLSVLRRQSDHTEGEVPVDCCQLRFTRLLLTGTLCCLVCRVVRFSTGSFGLNGSRECMFGTNSGCDCHFSGDNLIIQKERFL